MADNIQGNHPPVSWHEVNEEEEGGVPLPSNSPQATAEGENQEVGLIDRYYQSQEQLLKPVTAGWIKRNSQYSPSDNFIPLPYFTFAIDRPANLLCVICRVSVLAVEDTCTSDRNPAIMACGHIAGSKCLAEYFADPEREGLFNCPICQASLNHTRCGHRVKERVLTTESIRALPRTLPYGGVIHEKCTECRVDEARERQRELIEDATANVESVRQDHEASLTRESAMFLAGYIEELMDAMACQHQDTVKARDESRAW